jgi:hypothetical protein
MKYYSVTEYDPEGGFEPVIYVDGPGAFQRMDTDVFRRACRAISYDVYEVIALIRSDFPNASVWLFGNEIKVTFPNPADNS